MAGEYFRWKYRDVQPDKPIELTKEQKRRNWWDYHKWHVVIGIVLAFIAVDIGRSVLGIGVIRPDYQIGYVGEGILPDETVAAVESSLAALGEDLNGDGQVVVKLEQYVMVDGETDQENAYYAYGSQMTLMADLERQDSQFFLLQEPEAFQTSYQVLADGEGDFADRKHPVRSLVWADCPVLAGLELGTYQYNLVGEELTGDSQELLSGLSLVRRAYYRASEVKHLDAYNALWNALTEGAAS